MGAGLLATALSVGVVLSVLRDKVFILVLAHSSLVFFAVVGIAISLVVGKLMLIAERDKLNRAIEISFAFRRGCVDFTSRAMDPADYEPNDSCQ
jgi:hypothetical protein